MTNVLVSKNCKHNYGNFKNNWHGRLLYFAEYTDDTVHYNPLQALIKMQHEKGKACLLKLNRSFLKISGFAFSIWAEAALHLFTVCCHSDK